MYYRLLSNKNKIINLKYEQYFNVTQPESYSPMGLFYAPFTDLAIFLI